MSPTRITATLQIWQPIRVKTISIVRIGLIAESEQSRALTLRRR
jgi:hypothetical protein